MQDEKKQSYCSLTNYFWRVPDPFLLTPHDEYPLRRNTVNFSISQPTRIPINTQSSICVLLFTVLIFIVYKLPEKQNLYHQPKAVGEMNPDSGACKKRGRIMIILENITMRDFSKYLKQTKTIVFPFGTIEEHGSHLPLNTDSMIIQEVLKIAAEKRRFFLAPVVQYGVCTTTGDHPGTIGITPETLRCLSYDLIMDAYQKGLRNFLLISGHGGSLHMSALKETAELLIGRLKGSAIAVFTPYDLLWKELSEIAETQNDSHAGELETSMVLYISPDLVKGRAKEEYPGIPKPFIVKDKVKYWPGGVWGNPQKASAEKGVKAIHLMAGKVIEVLDSFEK
jgi:creatinine amidohydrolase